MTHLFQLQQLKMAHLNSGTFFLSLSLLFSPARNRNEVLSFHVDHGVSASARGIYYRVRRLMRGVDDSVRAEKVTQFFKCDAAFLTISIHTISNFLVTDASHFYFYF